MTTILFILMFICMLFIGFTFGKMHGLYQIKKAHDKTGKLVEELTKNDPEELGHKKDDTDEEIKRKTLTLLEWRSRSDTIKGRLEVIDELLSVNFKK